MASLNRKRVARRGTLTCTAGWLLLGLGLACTQAVEPARTPSSPTYTSRSLPSDDPAGPAPGFVVEDDSGQKRTITGDPDIPRPVEHAWASNGHLAYLIPPYGPVYVIRRPELAAWLQGAEPELVIRNVDDSGPAKTYRDLQWTDAGQLRFTAACCGTVAEVSVEMPSGTLRLGPWKPVHPR